MSRDIQLKERWEKLVNLQISFSIIIYSMNEQVNLVSPDYYPKGVDYDRQITKSKNLLALKDKVVCKKTGDSLEIIFPDFFVSKKIEGSIQFYFVTN